MAINRQPLGNPLGQPNTQVPQEEMNDDDLTMLLENGDGTLDVS